MREVGDFLARDGEWRLACESLALKGLGRGAARSFVTTALQRAERSGLHLHPFTPPEALYLEHVHVVTK